MRFVKFKIYILIISIIISSISCIAISSNDITEKITILHTNDMHGRIFPNSIDGMGLSKLATLVQKYRSENASTLLLDAGDTFHGTTFTTISQGESMAKILNVIGYDASVPGNHDFNYGYKRLLELDSLTKFPIICANVKKDNKTILTPYIIKQIGDIKVGIIGLSTPETLYKTSLKNIEGLDFTNPIKEANQIVAAIQDKVDIIIAVTHLGIDESSQYTSTRLALEVPQIDVIVDGHSHSTLPQGKQIGNTLIVQAGEYNKNLGVVDITLKNKKIIDKKASLILKEFTNEVADNKEVSEIITELEKEQVSLLSIPLGKTLTKLDGERQTVRYKESNLGNLIADAMIEATGAEISLINGGGIRASIDNSVITKGDVLRAFPFSNYVVTKKLKGFEIKSALEISAKHYPEENGGFLQVGGLKYSFDPQKEPENRITYISINGLPLNLNSEYIVATNDFIASGGDEYKMFSQHPILCEYSAVNEVLMNFLKSRMVVGYTLENRITHKTANEGFLATAADIQKYSKDPYIKLVINKNEVYTPVKPKIINGRSLVWVRTLCENLNAEVAWNSKAKTVTISKDTVNIQVVPGQAIAKVNGNVVNMGISSEVINNRLMIPTKFICEKFNTKINWDNKENTIFIGEN